MHQRNIRYSSLLDFHQDILEYLIITANRLLIPYILTHRRLDASARQFRGDGVRCHTLKGQAENQPHGFSLFGIDYNLTT